MRGGNPGASKCGGTLQSHSHEGGGDPPLMDKTTRQGTRFAPPSDSKKKRQRKSKDEEEEDKPTPFTNPAHKEGGGDEPMPSDLMEVDDTSKQEEIEGKYPPKREGEEDDPEDPEELGPLPVFDPFVHDFETQEEADIWRDGVLCKRAWVYYWDKKIAKEVRGVY